MIKKILLISLLLFTNLNGDYLFNKIENLVGKKQFLLHSNLIKHLFKDKENFYITQSQLNYKLILKVLKEKGLLNLKFNKPQELNIQFSTNTDPIKSLKNLNDTLKSMGYYYYFTKSNKYNSLDNSMDWVISFKTEYALDPYLLVQELKIKECIVLDIQKVSESFWKYKIDVKNAKIREAIKIDNNEKVVFQKPLRAYFIEVNNAKKLQIISRKLNHWFPYIAFYDKHLNVLKVTKKNRVYKGYKINVPRETKYIKITDLYTLINIKRGLSIIVK